MPATSRMQANLADKILLTNTFMPEKLLNPLASCNRDQSDTFPYRVQTLPASCKHCRSEILIVYFLVPENLTVVYILLPRLFLQTSMRCRFDFIISGLFQTLFWKVIYIMSLIWGQTFQNNAMTFKLLTRHRNVFSSLHL